MRMGRRIRGKVEPCFFICGECEGTGFGYSGYTLHTLFYTILHYFTRFPGNFHYQDCIRAALILGQYRNSNIPNSGWEVGNQDEDGPLDVIPIKMQDQKIVVLRTWFIIRQNDNGSEFIKWNIIIYNISRLGSSQLPNLHPIQREDYRPPFLPTPCQSPHQH